MASLPMSDPNASDPLAGLDPRVRAILQQVQATQSSQQPMDPTPLAAPPQPNGAAPMPMEAQPPPASQQSSPQPSSLAPVSSPPATPANHPGPVKSFLSNFLYGGGQALLQHVGLPTDYEKQQTAQKQALAQQGANDTSAYRQAMTGQLLNKAQEFDRTQQPFVIPNDKDSYGSLAGTPTTVGNFEALSKIGFKNFGATQVANVKADASRDVADTKAAGSLALQNLKAEGGDPSRHVLRSVGGVVGIYDKGTGNLVKSLGTDTAMITGPRNAYARAQAQAQFGVSNVMDADGNPTAVSRLQQLQSGAPTMGEKATQTLSGDKLGVQTYLSANQRVRDNIGILQDNTQRGIIARATEDVERNPGAIDSIINSALQSGLSPQGAELIAGMKQMNEFGSTFKKYTGNGGSSTDSLRATIHANQPSTSNDIRVNQQLLGQDEQLARGVQQNLSKPGKYTVPSRGGSTAAPEPAAPAGHPFFSQFGGTVAKP